MTTLMLNADGAPVSWLPLSIISWKDAIGYMTLDKATVLDWHDDWIVRSQRWETRVPAVMILKEYQKRKATVRFAKHNVFLRDNYICQYCGTTVTRSTATLDHVLPTSHGGKTTFENTVTACGSCNANKGNNKKIVPKHKPHKPSYYELVDKRRKMRWDLQHPSWANYLE